MANENEVYNETQSDFTFEELENAFYDLMHDFKKIKQENKKLKENIASFSDFKEKSSNMNDKLTQKVNILKHQNLELTIEKDNLSKENLVLKEELRKIKSFMEKFTYSSEKLEILLNNQRAIFNKTGLGYKSQKKQIFASCFYSYYLLSLWKIRA